LAEEERGSFTPPPPAPPKDPNAPTLWQVFLSVLAAFFGVQSQKNYQRDFAKGSPLQFILLGALATCLFIIGVMIAVRVALSKAGL
jgi:hypothetical protein